MKKIALIACSKKKLGADCPDRKFKSQDIYTGNTFKKSKAAYKSRFGCEDFHILSAKYNLLDKDEEIPYYDMYLGHQSSEYKKEWAETVLAKLRGKYDLKDTVFYIFGGRDYYKDLLPHLNCVVFGYISSGCIDLDSPKEFRNGGK